MDETAIDLLKQEMQSEEINVRVDAIQGKLRLVMLAIGKNDTTEKLIPYLQDLLNFEDDEVLYAIAKQLAEVFHMLDDKTAFLPLLKDLAGQSETVVRDQATKTMCTIAEQLSDQEVQHVFAPMVLQLAQGESFSQR